MTITLTAEDMPPRPRRSHLQELNWRRTLAVRHGNQELARRIEVEIAEAELWAAVERYRDRIGGNARPRFGAAVERRLVYGAV